MPNPQRGHRPSPRAAGAGDALAGEHALLLGRVTQQARDLLRTAAAGRWPGAELKALLTCAQTEVLPHASDEEALLFPGATAGTARLARDHVRLRAGTETLARAASGEQTLSPGQIAAITRDFVCQLERHIRAEELLLAANPSPGA